MFTPRVAAGPVPAATIPGKLPGLYPIPERFAWIPHQEYLGELRWRGATPSTRVGCHRKYLNSLGIA